MEEFVAVDLETTGMDPDLDAIIEIGAVRFVAGREVDSFTALVHPGRPLPSAIRRLTGITDEMLADAGSLEDALRALAEFAGRLPLVAHNAGFDLGFLRPALARFGLSLGPEVIDTLGLSRLLLPIAASHRLERLASRLSLRLEQGHRALDDARACGQLLVKLQEEAAALPLPVLMEMDTLLTAARWESRGALSKPLALAAAGFGGPGSRSAARPVTPASSAAVWEGAEESYWGSPEEDGERGSVEFSAAACEAVLGPTGALAAAYDNYEHRPGQLAMAEAVAGALETDRHLLVEAGTGTGKSLAYLVPSVLWALSSGERVAIATQTINLQEQLWEKDLPLLRQILGVPFRAALMKGRSNYLCLRKHRELVEDENDSLTPEELYFQARLISWVSQTETGDRAELGLFGEDEEFWWRVASETETCLGPKCPFHASKCFYYRNRRRAEEADILIANHSLVLADLEAGRQLLPEYSRLVLDEAHHLEQTATKQWGLQLNEAALSHFLRGLAASPRGKSRRRPGFLTLLRRSLHLNGPDGQEVRDLLTQAGDQAKDAASAAEDVFSALRALAAQSGRRSEEESAFTLRLREEHREADSYEPVDAARVNLVIRLRNLARGLGDISMRLADLPKRDRRLDGMLLELDRHAAASYQYAADLDFILCGHGEGYVHWLEIGKTVMLRAAPVRLGPVLQEKLFEVLPTVVMTSATLTVANRFDHLRERLGLDLLVADKVDQLTVPSPFRYREQVLLCIPEGLPTPRDGESAWRSAVEEGLLRLVQATQGRTLVLFTSHRMLRSTYERLRQPLEEAGLTLLGQGLDGSRSRVLESFLATPRSVLFGAASFWEGVDVPGDGLSCVAMVRLPFAPPGEPVTEARLEDLEQRGLSSFEHLSLPQAIMRFKQGFGRLVRTAQDRGVVVVFDGRLASGQARYAAKFLRSLPGPSILQAPLHEVVDRVRNFLQSPEEEPDHAHTLEQ